MDLQVLKFLSGLVLLSISVLAVALGTALLTNRKGLAESLQRYEERDAVTWNGPVALRHMYFKRVVRLYALGLIAWGAFYPSITVASWFGSAAAAFHALAAVSFLAMIGLALAMGWNSEKALTALGLPFLSFRPARLKSAPWQVNATFCTALSVGTLVDFVAALAGGIK